MHAHDSSFPNPDWLDQALCDALDVRDEVAETAWSRFTSEHITPGRVMQLAFDLSEPSEAELQHIQSCDACRSQYAYYRRVDDHESNGLAHSNGALAQRSLWPCSASESTNGNGHHSPPAARHVPGTVPPSLRAHFQIDGPVIMPGEEVAERTWQFGLLIQILKQLPEVGRQLICQICDAAFATLQTRWHGSAKTLALVCFGRAMHQCGIELATRFSDAGLGMPHVILAHDYYDPSLVCSRHEFANADVVVLVDVVHSGSLLRRLIAACERFSPVRVTGLVLVDQSTTALEGIEYLSLWSEEIEARVPLAQFLKQSPVDFINTLRRFEPNAECITHAPAISGTSKAHHLLPTIDPELLVHILGTDALKCDHPISGKRYPFVVNVLDLIKKNDESKQFIISCSKNVLADLAFQKTCFAFHVGRSQRAGKIAAALSANTGWPSIPIGTKGSAFKLTDSQCRQLACFDNVVIVDAAIRTGETLSAVSRAVLRETLCGRPRFIAFTVLNALTSKSKDQLMDELGIEVRSLFDFPLTPPTEEVRHWAAAQKLAIGAAMLNNPLFESIQPVLGDYCSTRHQKRRPTTKGQSRTDQIELTRQAIAYGRSSLYSAKEIANACQMKSSRAIRHLPISDVIHDSAMQSMLLGVMYNSVPAPLKESAVFGLAAADNYDWMNLKWLKCNRHFLNTTQAWKSVLLVECQMRLAGLKSQLSEFRDAATEFRESIKRDGVQTINANGFQQPFFPEFTPQEECLVEQPPRIDEKQRVMQRLETFIEVAG